MPEPEGGVLYVVATPIGNLEDITLRALRCLKEADRIAAEDTRRARALLSAYKIPAGRRLVSHHANSSPRAAGEILEAVAAGQKVALISEAGLPGFSDPGGELIRQALGRGLRVEVLPGATAAVTALVASGFLARRFCFAGFLPSRGNARIAELRDLVSRADPAVLYEAPQRLADLLTDLAALAPAREVCVARELTKLHQEIVRGTPEQLLERFRLTPPRGEVTVVLGSLEEPTGPDLHRDPAPEELAEARVAVERRRREGASLREAVRLSAVELSLSANRLYRALHGH